RISDEELARRTAQSERAKQERQELERKRKQGQEKKKEKEKKQQEQEKEKEKQKKQKPEKHHQEKEQKGDHQHPLPTTLTTAPIRQVNREADRQHAYRLLQEQKAAYEAEFRARWLTLDESVGATSDERPQKKPKLDPKPPPSRAEEPPP